MLNDFGLGLKQQNGRGSRIRRKTRAFGLGYSEPRLFPKEVVEGRFTKMTAVVWCELPLHVRHERRGLWVSLPDFDRRRIFFNANPQKSSVDRCT